MSAIKKPFLTAEQQVNHLESKGVQFNIYDKNQAVDYLKQHTNYFKLRAFRTAFPKYEAGIHQGKYLDLDFAYLCDLAIIDMRLRYVLIQIALDIEHFTKVLLLRKSELAKEDGYQIIEDYFSSLDQLHLINLTKELKARKHNDYCGPLIIKYEKSYPIWVFLEIVSFGTLIDFTKFCGQRFNDKEVRETYKMLLFVRLLRNAAAHSNCLLNRLDKKTAIYPTRHRLLAELIHSDLDPRWVKARMSNARIQQIITTLYIHKELVKSKGIHSRASRDLQELKSRINYHFEYYKSNFLVTSSLQFVTTIIDAWFSLEDNRDT